jgi:hypothetical protein
VLIKKIDAVTDSLLIDDSIRALAMIWSTKADEGGGKASSSGESLFISASACA